MDGCTDEALYPPLCVEYMLYVMLGILPAILPYLLQHCCFELPALIGV